MRPVYRLVLLVLLAFMFRTPLSRLQQSASHFTKTAVPLVRRSFSNTPVVLQGNDTMAEEKRPDSLIAKKGLELLTFGTPNGAYDRPQP